MTWRDEAACLAHPNFIEYPVYRQLLVCDGCPLNVRTDCLTAALDEEITGDRPRGDWPVRGGLTGDQRAQLLRDRQRPPRPIRHGTEGGANAHWRRGETPCPSCRQAANRGKREREQAAS